MEETDGRRLRYQHRREELLRAAVEHVAEHGLAQLSLRRIADTVGVSHATLVHHFSTRDQLVAEIVDHVLARAFASPELVPPGVPGGPLRALWRRAVAPEGRRSIRLFVAITGHAMYAEPAVAEAVRRSVDERLAMLSAGFVAAGCPPPEAAVLATTLLGVMRGLLVDLLVTGDEARVDAAFEAFVQGIELRLAQAAR
ncbi:TetR/AcrR family transcriptional regulator [Kineococcus sp. NUM-3379]